MLKKIFCAALTVVAIYFATVLIFVNAAAAEDVWVYTDRKSGTEYYVMTETINIRSKGDYHFDVNVKYVRGGALLAVKKYSFDGHDMISYAVDGVNQGFIFDPKKGGYIEPASTISGYCVRRHGLRNGMGEG